VSVSHQCSGRTTAHKRSSGQQFWLNYNIDHPIRAKAVSVEFHVDGKRVDTQFPLAVDGDGPAMVGPVQSSITSQYGKDADGNVYRRDVFFTLVDKVKEKGMSSSRPGSAIGRASAGSSGIIECKVYRAEKTGEWAGSITPDDIPEAILANSNTLRKKGLTHTVRLGASIPAAKTVRYTFKNLDPEDAPFAHFRFFYRSNKFLQRNRIGSWSLSRPGSPIPRPLSRSLMRKSSLYQSLSKGREFLTDKLSPRRAMSPEPMTSETSVGASNFDNLDATITRLEAEMAKNPAESERIGHFRGKMEPLQSTSSPKEKGKEASQPEQKPVPKVTVESIPSSSKKDSSSDHSSSTRRSYIEAEVPH
jgi:hypothetical protein